MRTDRIVIPRWFDRHLHLREGEMLKNVLPATLAQRPTGAVIMGNLPDGREISSVPKARNYKAFIQGLAAEVTGKFGDFQAKLAFYLKDDTEPDEVVQVFEEGLCCGVKLYMANQEGQGGTTGSQHGVRNLAGRRRVFEAMEKRGIPLFGHFEAVEEDVDEFDREAVSLLRDIPRILDWCPELTIIVEHVTDGHMAEFIATTRANVYGTVTAHHLMINRNAMFWGGMNPIHYCKPVPKREKHRRHVRELVTSGHRKFGAGTDSAPHDLSRKELCYGCAAGIFTAPIALELYTEVFWQDRHMQHLENFLSRNFLDIYGMEVSRETIILERHEQEVPKTLGGVPVFLGGQMIPWLLMK